MNALFAAFGLDWKLLLAQAINFGILLVALWYFLYTPVLGMIEKRRKVVAKGVEDAAKAAAELAEAGGKAEAMVGGAEREAEEIVKQARGAAGEERAKLLAEAQARATRLEEDGAARAAAAAARARAESEKEIARLAVLAAEKVLAKKV
ncbi:MAG: F0F1 ATP synthase subunit B [Minisyncoccia bacterium]